MSYHAKLSPSSAHRWRKCSASINAESGIADEGNDAARKGTVTHGVSSEALTAGCEPSEFLGREFLFCKANDGTRHENFREQIELNLDVTKLDLQHVYTVTDEMSAHAEAYVNFVRDLVATTGGTLLVEQRVPIGHITGEEGAGGTSDAIILTADEIIVVDAKFGYNKVTAYEIVKPAMPDPITGDEQPPVYAPNDQMALYAAGALHEHELFYDFKTVRMVIVQPPINHVSEFALPIEALNEHLEQVKIDAEATRTNRQFVPGDHCGYCKGRMTCQARDEYALRTALDGFDDPTDPTDPAQIAAAPTRQVHGDYLGVVYEKLPLLAAWVKDIETRVMERLNLGLPVTRADGIGYKLVLGKKGARQWSDAEAAEAALKRMRLKHDQMYDYSLISPTSAETLWETKKPKKGQEPVEPVLGERQANTLKRLITQADPKPTIALATDPRPAVGGALSGFDEQVSQPPTDSVDYFN